MPGGTLMECCRHSSNDLLRQRRVLLQVDRFDLKQSLPPMRFRIQTPDQRVAVQNWEGEVTIDALFRGRVGLDPIFKSKKRFGSLAIGNNRIEGRKESC